MNLQFDTNDLRPIVEEVVQLAMAEMNRYAPERIGYPEKEAAALVGMQPSMLADRRREPYVKACNKQRSVQAHAGDHRASIKVCERWIEEAEENLSTEVAELLK